MSKSASLETSWRGLNSGKFAILFNFIKVLQSFVAKLFFLVLIKLNLSFKTLENNMQAKPILK